MKVDTGWIIEAIRAGKLSDDDVWKLYYAAKDYIDHGGER